MDARSSFKAIGEAFSLVYKILVTAAAGGVLIAFAVACLHFREVHLGLREAERLVGLGQHAEADALATRLMPWARCFHGRARECGLIRIRAMVRTDQADEAVRLAETVRYEDRFPVRTGGYSALLSAPIPWIHRAVVPIAGNIMNAFLPAADPGEWAGYSVLLDELVAVRDARTLETVAADLIARFPSSPIAVLANASRGEIHSTALAQNDASAPRVWSATNRPAPIRPPPQPVTTASGTPPPAVAGTGQSDEPAMTPIWGIVTNTSAVAVNPESGQPVRQLKPGDVLAIEGTCTVRGTSALKGTLILTNRNVPDLAFRGEDLEILPGAYHEVPPEEVALRSRLAEIVLEEANLRVKASRETANLSPQEKAYRQAAERMDAFKREVASLQAKMDHATGNERMAAIDRLRQMKYQEQTLLRDLQQKRDALGPQAGAGGSAAEKLQALLLEKQAIVKRIRAFAP